MEDAAEDSDATVAGDEIELNGDPQLSTKQTGRSCSQSTPHTLPAPAAPLSIPNEEECSDNNETGPSSPSLLQSVQHLSLRKTSSSHIGQNIESRDRNNKSLVNNNEEKVVPCVSDEELSQEFPVLKSSTTVPACSTSLSTSNPPHITVTTHHGLQQSTAPQAPSLNDITNKQNTLLAKLNKAEGITEKAVKEAKRNASKIEQTLKAISLSNQAERKRLASEHALLLSQSTSLGIGGGGLSSGRTQSIRAQLLDLAAKQKQLLQCFVKQKEISSQLSKVLQTIPAIPQHVVQQIPTHSLTPSNPNVSTMTTQSKCTNSQVHKTSLNTNFKTSTCTSSAHSETLQSRSIAKNTACSVSAVFPNLTNQLLQPPTIPQQSKTLPQSQTLQHKRQLPSKQHTLQPQALPLSQSSTQSYTEHAQPTSTQQIPSQTQMRVASSGSSKAPVSSNDLSHPVPLKTLMKHGLIRPGKDCVSCTILGCAFKASLCVDATIVSHDGSKHELPQQWVKSCWARLGHPNKIVKTKPIYSLVLYNGVPLLHFCEKYSLKQVSSYLSQNKQTAEVSKQRLHPTTNKPQDSSSKTSQPIVVSTLTPQTQVATNLANSYDVLHSHDQFDIDRILTCGLVFVYHCDGAHHKDISLEVTEDFWEDKEGSVSPVVLQQIEYDLEW